MTTLIDSSDVAFTNRFWAKVEKDPDGCWEWKGAVRSDGYGQFLVCPSSNHVQGAHRVAYQLRFGEIPEGKFILHECDNAVCVRPEHLYVGDQADNLRDAVVRGRAKPYFRPRLSDEEVVHIRKLALTQTNSQIANQYDLSVGYVWNVVNRKRRKYAEARLGIPEVV